MPDTMIAAAEPAAVASPYRSALIGQLVAARAKATKEIKTIVKDKKATIPNKNGGAGYQYAYADLADVMEAVDDALAAQELALFQTIQDRGKGAVLVTTLAHSSDQWIASEVRIASPDAGPQVFGSSLTYMRRYCALGILGLAPDTDDDGKAAQERADQQARQKATQRVEQQRSTQSPSKTSEAIQRPPSESDEPVHTPVQGSNVGPWLSDAWDLLNERPVEWRRKWLTLHGDELAQVRAKRADWADNIEALANDDGGSGA
jgi:hypothetical protein